MNKFLLALTLLVSTLVAGDALHSKKGFLTTAACAKAGTFADCQLKNYKFDDLVLFVHDEGKYYHVKAKDTKVIAALDQGFSRNEITLYSNNTTSDTIKVEKVEMPAVTKVPPFKGCM